MHPQTEKAARDSFSASRGSMSVTSGSEIEPHISRMTRTYRTLLSSRGGVLRQEPCTVRNMHGALIEAHELSPGTDLKKAFIAATLHWIDAGWLLGEFSSTGGVFFCTRSTERRMVSITPTDPGKTPPYGAAHLSSSPGCED